MRGHALISFFLLFLAVSCIEKEPSWIVSWENEDLGKETSVTPTPAQETDTLDKADDIIPADVPLLNAFSQDFDTSDTAPFSFRLHSDGDDFRYFTNFPSLSETGTDILMMRLDTEDFPSDGPNLEASAHTFYGSYSFRIKTPDISRVKRTTDAVMEISLSGNDPEAGVSGIGIELPLSQPSKMTVTSLSGSEKSQSGRSVAVMLTESQYPSSKFQTIGWDWAPDYIRWWILDASTEEKTVINEIVGKEDVPWLPAVLSLKIYHSTEAPRYPFETEIDNISYQPFSEYIREWKEKYFENY